MPKTILTLALLFAARAAFAQCAVPKDSIFIGDADVKAVLAAGAKRTPPAVDQQLRTVDLCKYNLAVGIIHRGPTASTAGSQGKAKAAPKQAPAADRCSSSPAPANAASSGVNGISHDDETETYVIVSGGGTLVTGGTIANGSKSAPESEVTKVLNGPSCSGTIMGSVTKRVVVPGDIIVIPYGVPHGWTDIADHVDYLSVRPDPSHVLESGYVNPIIKK